jgi:hypothetical protein
MSSKVCPFLFFVVLVSTLKEKLSVLALLEVSEITEKAESFYSANPRSKYRKLGFIKEEYGEWEK